MSKLAIGQEIKGKVVRIASFGVFIEYQGDILIPSSEPWARFSEPSELVSIGDDISGKVFKIDQENMQVAVVKAINSEPWTVIMN